MKKIDHTKFSDKGPPRDEAIDRRWWLAKKEERAASVSSVIHQLIENDSARRAQYHRSARLYGNVSLIGLGLMSQTPGNTASPGRISFNVVQSVVDTVVAKMVKNKPKPMFLTSGGNYKIQRRAKKLDKFVEGIFYENDAYHLLTQSLRDAGVLADGFIHVFESSGRVKYERVAASELHTDWAEAFYGSPMQLHRVKTMDRASLSELFKDEPERVALIRDAAPATSKFTGAHRNVADQVVVGESWRLPSGPDAGDGIHSINLLSEDEGESHNLLDEEYEDEFFPFAKLPWAEPLYGYWSQSAAERLQNLQFELNKMLWVEQRSFHLAGSFKILRERGSKVVQEHFNNEVGTIIDYTGTKPEYVVPPVLPPGFQERKQFLIEKAFDQEGVSQLSATSQKPAGLNSGRALREYNDIESDRFMVLGQSLERCCLMLSRLSIACAKRIFAREKSYKVKVPGTKFLQTIDWKDVNLADDEFVMKMFPVSSLPKDPSGRLQTIQEYIQAGMIDPLTGRRLLDFPDLEQHENLLSAQQEWINMVLEKIVDDGEYTSPDPFMKLDLAKWFCLMYYAQGQTNGLEEEKLNMLRDFSDQIDALVQKATPPAPPAPQAGQGPAAMPQAAPMAPPSSDMIPNVPQPVGAQ